MLLDPDEVEKAPGFINDNDSHLVFEGNWGHGDQEENGRIIDEAYAGGGYAYLGQSEGSVKLSFKGTEISVLMEKKPGNGFVDIFLDGQQMFSEDDDSGAWNTNTTGDKDPNFIVFSRTGLDDKIHTIEVRNADPYGYGWIYLTGFLTDGQAVDYVEIKPEDPKPIDPGPDDKQPSDNNSKPVIPDTGVGLPLLIIFSALASGSIILISKKRTW